PQQFCLKMVFLAFSTVRTFKSPRPAESLGLKPHLKGRPNGYMPRKEVYCEQFGSSCSSARKVGVHPRCATIMSTLMPLPTGTRLGQYELLAPLGAGGMGEVYRARDTRLDREVAIKILPEVLAEDPEKLSRFDREAKVLASLNHPNIAQIYGVEGRALV